MAEFAQRSIEEMLVELDKMRKLALFTTEETRAIMKKRKRFEYKMQRRTKEKEVYLEYIQYEIGVLKLVRLRREKKRVELYKDEIDKAIALRIYKLFRIACFRFKNDIKLWLTQIDFAKANLDKERVSKIFTTMLQVHNKKPSLWIMAAKYEFETNESIETARSLFQRALRFLPASQKLWTEYFRMELLCVEVIMKRKELLGIVDDEVEDSKEKRVEDAILNCKVAEVVFKNAIKQIDEENVPQLIQSFILIANEFTFTSNLIEVIYKMLDDDGDKFKSCEETRNVLARRSLLKESEILKKCQETGQIADFTIAELEEKANAAFLRALSELPTQKMHTIYVRFCLERLKLNSQFLNEERFERLNNALKTSNDKFGLEIGLLIEWVENLLKFGKYAEAKILLESSLKANETNGKLWKLQLKMLIQTETYENLILESFEKSLKCLKLRDAFDIWELLVNWSLLNNVDNLEKIFKEGSQVSSKEIATFCRCNYLKWSLQKEDGLDKCKEIYKNYRQLPPFDLDFFLNYIQIELNAPVLDLKSVCLAYEDALSHYGKENIDLWVSYIEFCYENVSKLSATQRNVANIYWQAMKQLDSSLIESFTQKTCLMKLNLTQPDDSSLVEMK